MTDKIVRNTCHGLRSGSLHIAYGSPKYFTKARIVPSVPDENIGNDSEGLCIGRTNP